MNAFLDETQIELVVLSVLQELGYATAFGPDIACDGERPERASYADVVLVERLRTALERLNPKVPSDAIDEAVRRVILTETPSLIENNRRFHTLLTDSVSVEYQGADGRTIHDQVWLVDFDDPDRNNWPAQHAWLAEMLEVFQRMFAPRVKELDAEDLAAPPSGSLAIQPK